MNWIKVEDQLPPENTIVLVYDGRDFEVVLYTEDYPERSDFIDLYDGEAIGISYPTHWCFLIPPQEN